MSAEHISSDDSLDGAKPDSINDFPEGFDVREEVKEIIKDLPHSHVIDYGCGSGRLCETFKPEAYLGVDIDPHAIEEAKKKFSSYSFQVVPEGPMGADLYFAYSVFNYLNDRQLHEALKNIRCKWLVVGELLGKEWKEHDLPKLHHRDLQDYVKLMRTHDLILQRHVKKPYKKYADSPWYQGNNTDISFLVFKKCLRNPLV